MTNILDKTLKILVVEDNPADSLMVEEIIKEYAKGHFQAEVAQRLNDAIEQLNANTYDIVLLDLFLPDSSSLETLYILRAHFPHLPVIIMTGMADETVAVNAVRAGAQDFFRKSELSFDNGHSFIKCVRFAYERERNLNQNLKIKHPESPSLQQTDNAIRALSGVIEQLKKYGN